MALEKLLYPWTVCNVRDRDYRFIWTDVTKNAFLFLSHPKKQPAACGDV